MVERCFTMMLDTWLQGETAPSVDRLVSALQMPGVDQRVLALDIDKNRKSEHMSSDYGVVLKWSSKVPISFLTCIEKVGRTAAGDKSKQCSYVNHYSQPSSYFYCLYIIIGVSFDLPYLCERLNVCKSSWFMLGLGLGIKSDILKRIESERTGNSVENCLFDLLVFWLNSGNASVKNLVDALIKVNMRVLADKIQKKYAGMV